MSGPNGGRESSVRRVPSRDVVVRSDRVDDALGQSPQAEHAFERLEDARLVVDEEDPHGCIDGRKEGASDATIGRRMTKVVPTPSSVSKSI